MNRRRQEEEQKKFDSLPNSSFKELFIQSLKKEINHEKKKTFPPFNKTKREIWINKMTKLLRELESGVIPDKEIKKTKKNFERSRNEYTLSTYLWIFMIILILGCSSFIVIVTAVLR